MNSIQTHSFLKMKKLAQFLKVSRRGYYFWKYPPQESQRDRDPQRLILKIRCIHQKSRATYGSPRIHAELLAQGEKCSRPRIARLMQKMNLHAKTKKRFSRGSSKSVASSRVAPNLLRQSFQAFRPNQIWVSDITCLPTAQGWVYLAVTLDLFSRRVVGWEVQRHLKTQLVLNAFQKAVFQRKPTANLIHHSDQGCQYTSQAFKQATEAQGASL